jgi:hypothetical protein
MALLSGGLIGTADWQSACLPHNGERLCCCTGASVSEGSFGAGVSMTCLAEGWPERPIGNRPAGCLRPTRPTTGEGLCCCTGHPFLEDHSAWE